MKGQRLSAGYFFVMPAILVLGVMVAYPLVNTAFLAFTNDAGHFVGLNNFRIIVGSPVTAQATYNSIYYVGGSIVLELFLGVVAGILLDRRFVGRGVVRSILLIPWVVPGIVAATTWAWMYHYEFGIINYGLEALHIIGKPVGWLTDATLVKPSLIAVNVWKMFPFVALMVLASLQGIPEELYEAARIDGASFYHEVRFIMLPHLAGVLTSVTLLLLIWGMNAITIIYAMTTGGPANQSLILPIQIFKEAFENFSFNTAAALSLILFTVLFIVIVGQVAISQRREKSGGR